MIEYPYVIVTKERPETLFSVKDFEYLLEQMIGPDAVQFFRLMTEISTDGLEMENRELLLENDRLTTENLRLKKLMRQGGRA